MPTPHAHEAEMMFRPKALINGKLVEGAPISICSCGAQVPAQKRSK
jgi:hypothetical protein